MGHGKYILIGKKPMLVTNLLLWGKVMEATDRHVAKENVGHYRVSTVFLGLDHNFGDGEPLLFETMVFDESKTETVWGHKISPSVDEDGLFARYHTYEEAEDGHKQIVELLKKRIAEVKK